MFKNYGLLLVSAIILVASCQPVHRTTGGGSGIPPTAPDIAYAFRSMNTVGTVADGLCTFKMELDVISLKDEWQTIRLFSQDVSVTETALLVGDEQNALITRKDDDYYLMLGKSGSYRIQIEFAQQVREENNLRILTLPCVVALKSIYKVTVPEADIRVTTDPVVNFSVKPSGSTTDIFLYGANTPEVALSWQSRAVSTAIQPVVIAEHNRLVSVNRGSAVIQSTYAFDVIQGSVDKFSIAIEDRINILDVKGDGIKSWSVSGDGESRAIKIALAQEVSKRYVLLLTAEKQITGIPSEFNLPRMHIEGVKEKGFVAIAPQKGLKVDVISQSSVSQVDIAELPPELQNPNGQVSLAFRYVQGEIAISLNIGDVQPKVSVETITSVKVSKDFLALSSQIGFTIRDAGVFKFSIKLPDGLKVSTISGQNINNWQVKDEILMVDLSTKSEGYYLLILETERMITKPDDVRISVPEVLNVEREVGYITLTNTPAVKLEVVKLEGVRQINVYDVPTVAEGDGKTVKLVAVEKFDLAFRYLKHPISIYVNVMDIMPDVEATLNMFYTITERDIQTEANVAYNILKAGVFSLKLKVSQGLKITALNGAGIDDWKHDEKDGLLTITLKARTEGLYNLVIVGEQAITDISTGVKIPSFQLLDAKKERGVLAFASDAVLRLKTDSKESSNITEMDIKDLPPVLRAKGNIVLAHKYYEQPWKLTLAIERIKSRVNVETFNFISIGEGVVYHSVTLNYQILYAGISQFKIKLPAGVKRVDIDGMNIKHKEEEKKDDGDEWVITLHSQVVGGYPLYVTFQRDIDVKGGSKSAFEYTGVKAIGVERETGFIGVSARPDIQLIGDDIHTEGLTPIDEKEVPPSYKSGITIPFLAVYRYLGHPYSMKAELIRHKYAGILVAIVENCLFSTTVTEEGHMVTDIQMQVRNTREQYLKLYLPPGAEIWHVFVNGEEVTPFTSSESKEIGKETLIPINKAGKGGWLFEVSMRYGVRREALGSLGKLELLCPPISIPAMRIGYVLSLPDGYEVLDVGGNMKLVDFLDAPLAQMGSRQEKVAQPNLPKEGEVSAGGSQVDIQIEKNKWAQEHLYGVTGDKGATGGLPGMYTGNKPVSRKVYLFQTLIPMREVGYISLQYTKVTMGYISKGAMFLILIAGCFFFWNKVRFTAGVKVVVMLGIGLLLLTLQILWERSYAEHLSIGVWTVVFMTVIMACWDVGYKIWLRRQKDRQSGLASVKESSTEGM